MSIVRLKSSIDSENGTYYIYDNSDPPIGEGGMGIVYRGQYRNEKKGITKYVAIKLLYEDLPDHVIARAKREASIKLKNDNLIEMLDFIEVKQMDVLGHGRIRYHVISEFLHGISLEDLLEGKNTDIYGNIMPFDQELYYKYKNDNYHFAIYIIRNILSGLMALHDSGYIHRDLDPSNIMITIDNHIKLIDFGIAKRVSSLNTNDKSFTSTGQFIGKPKYAAPELALGDVNNQSYTTDIYALGIMLFQFITGTVPFEGEMHEILDMQIRGKIPLKKLKHKELEAVVKKSTQKKQSLRYQSSAEFRVAIDRLMLLKYSDSNSHKTMLVASSVIISFILIFSSLYFFNDRIFKPAEDKKIFIIENNSKIEKSEESKNDVYVSSNVEYDNNTYEHAVTLLKNEATSQKGFEILNQLAEADHYEATFLLSRLYFKSSHNKDTAVDSILEMQANLNIVKDNQKAHQLLCKAVSLNDKDYKSLYELGCDYKAGKDRGGQQDIILAKEYLEKAFSLVRKTNDQNYKSKITDRKRNL